MPSPSIMGFSGEVTYVAKRTKKLQQQLLAHLNELNTSIDSNINKRWFGARYTNKDLAWVRAEQNTLQGFLNQLSACQFATLANCNESIATILTIANNMRQHFWHSKQTPYQPNGSAETGDRINRCRQLVGNPNYQNNITVTLRDAEAEQQLIQQLIQQTDVATLLWLVCIRHLGLAHDTKASQTLCQSLRSSDTPCVQAIPKLLDIENCGNVIIDETALEQLTFLFNQYARAQQRQQAKTNIDAEAFVCHTELRKPVSPNLSATKLPVAGLLATNSTQHTAPMHRNTAAIALASH